MSFRSDLSDICRDLLCIDDIEVLASEYNRKLTQCLDDHAPIVTKQQVMRPKVKWYNSSLKELKRARRKAERTWRRTDLESDFTRYKQVKNRYCNQVTDAHRNHYEQEILDASGNQRKLFSIIQDLASVKKTSALPDHDSLQELADRFGDFFMDKIDNIRKEIDSQPCSFQSHSHSQPPDVTFSDFVPLSEDDVRKLIFKSKSTSCNLDPIPTPILKDCIEIVLPVLTKMINLSLQHGIFPNEWKLALVVPLLKKFGLELLLPNFRPASNLSFVSKLTERAVIRQENTHIQTNCPLPDCASAYREGHSTESALIKVQADILRNMEE